MTDAISITQAGEIDADWVNDGSPDDGLRIVSYKTVTLLTVPNLNGSAPTYEYRRTNPLTGEYAPAYYHISGPTLSEWTIQAEYRDHNETVAGLRQY